jgi:hypothetical protein
MALSPIVSIQRTPARRPVDIVIRDGIMPLKIGNGSSDLQNPLIRASGKIQLTQSIPKHPLSRTAEFTIAGNITRTHLRVAENLWVVGEPFTLNRSGSHYPFPYRG